VGGRPQAVRVQRAQTRHICRASPATAAPASTEAHEQLQQYGVFRLAYDTANVSRQR
jgi:hypothetical protein